MNNVGEQDSDDIGKDDVGLRLDTAAKPMESHRVRMGRHDEIGNGSGKIGSYYKLGGMLGSKDVLPKAEESDENGKEEDDEPVKLEQI